MPGFPPTVPDECEQLLAYLDHQRALVRLTGYGLTDHQARLAPSASALSIGGIVKHLTAVEHHWRGTVEQAEPPTGSMEERMAAHQAQFQMAETETLDGILEAYAAAGRETDAAVRRLGLDHPVPVPQGVPWFPEGMPPWSVRWVVLHLIEETARHCGHADIVRETLDGATWLALLAAAEGWEVLPPGVRRWEPAAG